MKGESNHEGLILKLHDFCVNCGDNIFMEFVWVQTIKRIKPCDDDKAKEIINEVKLIIESLNPAKKKSLAPKLVEFGINRPSDIAKQTDIEVLQKVLEIVRGL